MAVRPIMVRLFSILNFGVLCAAYYRLATLNTSSQTYRLSLMAGAAALLLAALVTFSTRVRELWKKSLSFINLSVYALAAVTPWLALTALVATSGLWWTQRPPELRFFVAYALANWAVGLCIAGSGTRSISQTRRVIVWLAAILGAIAINGLAFGVSPFGCGLSATIAAAGALALGVAIFGSTSACLKLFAASVATALAVAIVETTVRLLHVGQTVQEVDSREYARRFYSLTPPGAAFVNKPNALDEFGPALIEINSLGIRGPEIPDNRADVLLIGDSMIEARQLPWDQTLGPRLQKAFRARAIPLRVVAHGMRGWSPLLEWNWYLKVGRKLQPRTVLLFFFWNDLWTAGDEVTTFRTRLSPDGRPEYFDVPVDSSWIWYKHVRVVRLVEDVWRRLSISGLKRTFSDLTAGGPSPGGLDTAAAQERARKLTEPPLTASEIRALLTEPEENLDPALRPLARRSFWPTMRPWDLWTEAQRAAADRTELTFQRFAEDIASDGGRLVIVFVPNPLQIAPTECAVGRLFERVDTDVVLPPESGIQTWIRAVGDRHGIEVLDPSASMREHVSNQPISGGPLYLRADCHWSERGHQFMADYLSTWVLRHMLPQQ